ncbi:glycosyltransferase [Dyadobacter sp. Leaf189]|uniref:glycosyltransferase n=1 Tax=Dyadobacter sp. Leaf189 TaxID=1736295 RepID=UPI0006FDCB06|nr:glycosyltransferase [Dyadobacter sp. Leaf189]KQS27045.1 hypothetical protein ASG33_21160 [Dyadobacter sp. Leaf189]
MKIIVFTHPPFLEHKSMHRYAHMLGEGMKKRGHKVSYWTASPLFFKIPVSGALKKWLSYVDQYIVFPLLLKYRMRRNDEHTLYVFTDHALGPWIPAVAHKPHVVHCHDFMAQFSAEGKFVENAVGWSGRQFQSLIRRGFNKGRHFISISEKTQSDLHFFLSEKAPITSKMIHNGLNPIFKPHSQLDARIRLTVRTGIDMMDGYLLHVGGNQWYKNRQGVIEIYNTWRKSARWPLPLLLFGSKPNKALSDCYEKSPYKRDIHFISGMPDCVIHLAYAGASLLLFPSYSEGFGWPVIEAMGSGCMVLTTDEETLRVVCSDAAFLIPVRPQLPEDIEQWAEFAAHIVSRVLAFSDSERTQVIERGFANVKRFDAEAKLNEIEEIYKTIVNIPTT